MEITVTMVKELREETGAGVLDCKKALEVSNGDFEHAVEHLREKGLAAAAKRADREAKEGLIESYVHAGSRVGALLELNCETDFVARTEEFRQLAHDLAMQVVASRPQYLSKEDVPAETLEAERNKYRAQFVDSGKPDHIIDRIIEGKLQKFYEEFCLTEQPFIRDGDLTIQEVLTQAIAKLGENIVVRRFVRFALGEGP